MTIRFKTLRRRLPRAIAEALLGAVVGVGAGAFPALPASGADSAVYFTYPPHRAELVAAPGWIPPGVADWGGVGIGVFSETGAAASVAASGALAPGAPPHIEGLAIGASGAVYFGSVGEAADANARSVFRKSPNSAAGSSSAASEFVARVVDRVSGVPPGWSMDLAVAAHSVAAGDSLTSETIYFTFPSWDPALAPGPDWLGSTTGRGGVGVLTPGGPGAVGGAGAGWTVSAAFVIPPGPDFLMVEGLAAAADGGLYFAVRGGSGEGGSFNHTLWRRSPDGLAAPVAVLLDNLNGVSASWSIDLAVKPDLAGAGGAAGGEAVYFTWPSWSISSAPGPAWLGSYTGAGGVGRLVPLGAAAPTPVFDAELLIPAGLYGAPPRIEGLAAGADGSLAFMATGGVGGPSQTSGMLVLRNADGTGRGLRVYDPGSGARVGWSPDVALRPPAAPATCAGAAPISAAIRGARVALLDASPAATPGRARFRYSLSRGPDAPAGLPLAIRIGLGSCANATFSPEPASLGFDAATGLDGAAWVLAPGAGAMEIAIEVDGPAATGAARAGAIAGAAFEVAAIAGPVCACAGAGEPDAVLGIDFAAGGVLAGDPLGSWLGGALRLDAPTTPGAQIELPTATVDARGLCLFAPAPGDNIGAWFSPAGWAPLVDLAVRRIRARIAADQTAPDAIPLWNLIYDNYNPNGMGNIYGGQAWFLDAAGGAMGAGRFMNEFEAWAAPNAALTPQWRGLLGQGGGAFDPEADDVNDTRVVFRVLDLASAPLAAEADFGTICLAGLRIETWPIAALAVVSVADGAPISSATHAAAALDQAPALAEIDDARGVAIYELNTASDRATLFPAAPPWGAAELYPVRWVSGALYKLTAGIATAEAAPGGADPVDALGLNFDTATHELGQTHVSTRGSAGNLWRAAAPRRPSEAGGPQTYVGFMSGHRATLATIPPQGESDRLRPMVDLFNAPDLFGVGTGADRTEVWSLKVEVVRAP